MSSEHDASPFRSNGMPAVAPLTLRYCGWAVSQVLQVLLLAALFGAASVADLMKSASLFWAALLVVIVAAAKLPILTLRVRSEGGHLVAEGTRFPGPVTHWTCSLREAAGFVVTSQMDGRHTFHAVALRTTDGRVFPLTAAYACLRLGPTRAAKRLDAWLETARG
jgi:hypothetical protein